jgi:hypothetical protein
MDASSYALVHGVRATRGALSAWRERPWPVLKLWLLGSLIAACLLLLAVWVVALLSPSRGVGIPTHPPFAVGGPVDVAQVLAHNFLVLALHAMACVAGFIAGSSLPLQAEQHQGFVRVLHERGRPLALGFVVCATGFSLCMQAYTLGTSLARIAAGIGAAPGMVIVGLLPHALPELVALFLPLAAWIVASRRGDWDRLLAATLVTVAIAIPVLVIAALWEVYVAPHVLGALLGYA